jgi:hypothetical protein
MQQVLNEVGQIAQRLSAVIWQVLQFIWNWSFGQVVKMFQLSFNGLPLWKQVLFVIVIAALAYFLYKVAKDLLKAMQSVLGAIVGLISALIAMLPQIVYAGLLAFGGAWIITHMNPVWVPIALQ